MGTVLPGVLGGHWRFAHINGVRGDGVNPGLPGMDGTVSEDAVRSRKRRVIPDPSDVLTVPALGWSVPLRDLHERTPPSG